MNNGDRELRLLVDTDHGLMPIPILLREGSLLAAMNTLADEEAKFRKDFQIASIARMDARRTAGAIAPLVSLVLYLCSANAELRDARGTGRQPAYARATKTKRGKKLIAAASPTTWEVGYRLGAAIRRAEAREPTRAEGTHASPRPHLRRAHWHHFWTGPLKGERTLSLKWLPPVNVGVSDEELPATVRPVEG
jgi:hypothetical protein